MFKIIINLFKKDFICILMKYYLMFKIIIHFKMILYALMNKIIMYFKWTIIAFEWNIILMFMIIIHAFQMDINCILIKYYFNV